MLKQSQLYGDADKHLCLAKKMEIAGIHNMRANLRYYQKKKGKTFDEHIAALSQCIVEINEKKLEEFEQKLDTLIVYKGKNISYRQLMRDEVLQFQKHVLVDEKYKPYKYY